MWMPKTLPVFWTEIGPNTKEHLKKFDLKYFRHKKSGKFFNTLCKSSRKIPKLENYIWHDMCRKLRAVNCDVKSMRLLWWSRLARCAISPRLKKVKVPRLNEVFKVFHTTNEAEGGHNGVKDILKLYFFVKNASREPCWFLVYPNVFSRQTDVGSSPPKRDICSLNYSLRLQKC